MKHTNNTTIRDVMASIVVFLVALPLCMGIAIASGAPPATGLIARFVGKRVYPSLDDALAVVARAAGARLH